MCADLTLNSLLEKIKHENANKIKKYIFKLNIFILYIYINNSAGQVVEWEHGEGGCLVLHGLNDHLRVWIGRSSRCVYAQILSWQIVDRR